MSASNHVAGSDSGGGNGHDCSRRCSGVRANGRGSESLAADGFVLAEEVGVVCSHVFIGAVVGEEAGGVRGLQSRVHWNYTWRASGGVYSRGCMRGRRMKKHQVSFINKFGPNINFGNIDINEVMSLESLRLGCRSDTLNIINDSDNFEQIWTRHQKKSK